MMAPDIEREAKQAIALIKVFSLELEHYSPESQVMYWLNTYRAAWIRDAIIEAVFQGRYKIISVDHMLSIWHRRGQPVCHFTSGFEKTIASHLGSPIHMSPSMMAQPSQALPEDQSGFDQRQPTPYDFAPSPLSSSVMPSSTSQAPETEPSADALSHSHLSIDAFPVDPIDNLVEIYKASNAPKLPEKSPYQGAQPDALEAADELNAANRYIVQESQPIQPFRPIALPNGAA